MNNLNLQKRLSAGLIIFLLFLISGISFADDGYTDNPEDLAELWLSELTYYEDSSNHIYIDYPSSWVIEEQNMDAVHFITFVSDPDFFGQTGIGFAIGTSKVKNAESVETIWEDFVYLLGMDMYEYTETEILGVQVLHSTNIEEYSNAYNKIFVYIVDGWAYMILSTICPESYSTQFKPVVEEMVTTAFINHPALME
jgi:hypothetical protein